MPIKETLNRPLRNTDSTLALKVSPFWRLNWPNVVNFQVLFFLKNVFELVESFYHQLIVIYFLGFKQTINQSV